MRCPWIRGFNLACRRNPFVKSLDPYIRSIKRAAPAMPVRPLIKACNQIQLCSESHSPFSQQLDWVAVSLQPLSQHGEEQPEEHLHEPPSLHEHWFASHPQSLHVQSSPQHMHAVALALVKVARASGVATTAPSNASPANDLINIEISLVSKKVKIQTARRFFVTESRHREGLGVCYD